MFKANEGGAIAFVKAMSVPSTGKQWPSDKRMRIQLQSASCLLTYARFAQFE